MLILQKKMGVGISTPWDLSEASYTGVSFDLSSQGVSYWSEIAFSADGTKMYASNSSTHIIHQYTLSTAWDLSTTSYASKSYSVSISTAMRFNGDGTKLFHGTNEIIESDLSVAWDISTASASGTTLSQNSPGGPGGSLGSIAFSTDGLVLYGVTDAVNDTVFQRTLNSAYDIALANGSWNGTRTLIAGNPAYGMFFNSDYSKMFTISSNGNNILTYIVDTPGDITNLTAVPAETFNVNGAIPAITSSHGLYFNSTGNKFYVLDNTTDTVYQFTT